ncbi:MAG: hypothetical protein H3C35_04120 [Bacteroidetes bacterium]|nr:hypothetical protein [Bacteroidota bacterium]
MKLHITSVLLLIIIFLTVVGGFLFVRNISQRNHMKNTISLETERSVAYGDISVERYFRNGKTVKALGFYRNGVKKSEYYVTDSSGKSYQYISYFPNGNKKNQIEQWVENGQIQYYEEEYYENGHLKKKEGTQIRQWEYYDEDGRPTMFIVNDQTKTTEIVFYPNGKIQYQAEYFNGKLNGMWKKWDSLGNVTSEEVYKNGQQVL